MHTDFLVIGGGVIGITISAELRRRFPDCSVHLIEKEPALAQHASGRNSGVLHAGFYYTADSLKARFTREGNRMMREFCEEHRLRMNPCGKLVVAKNQAELSGLDELKRRGEKNGVVLEELTQPEAEIREPRARTYQRALFAPTTATVDPTEVTQALRKEAERLGVGIKTGVRYLSNRGCSILTNEGSIEAGFVVNAAGLYADRIAKNFGFGLQYRILPFKGLYLYATGQPQPFRTNIYPVPNLANPFLGVHITITVDGKAKLGPTAIPCLWREHYDGFAGFNLNEMLEIAGLQTSLFLNAGFDFRTIALSEIKKYHSPYLVSQASPLVKNIHELNFTKWGKPGIRAQLLDIQKRTLVMDFVLEGDSRSLHVLNAVSPAFTCALPFASYVCEQIVTAK